jgi:hypothetical protein
VRQFFSNDFAGTVRESEGILKLLGKGPAANRRDVQQQAVLRIIQFQSGTQFGLFVNSLAYDACRQHGRCDVSRLISHQASIRARDYTLTAKAVDNRGAATRFGTARPRNAASSGSSSPGSPGVRNSAAQAPGGNRAATEADNSAGFMAVEFDRRPAALAADLPHG